MKQLIPALTAAALVVTMFAIHSSFAQPEVQPRPGLTRSQAVVCSGDQEIVISGRLIETPGNGVHVMGDCEVVITDSHIAAGGVGVLVQGDGEVLIRDSYVQGAEAAILAQGDAEVMYSGSTIDGAVRTVGDAEVMDGGANKVLAGARATHTIRSSGAGFATGTDVIESGGSTVRIGSGGVIVQDAGGESVGVNLQE